MKTLCPCASVLKNTVHTEAAAFSIIRSVNHAAGKRRLGCSGRAARVAAALAVLCGLNAFGGISDMPTLNWLGREKMTDDLRQVALRILREDRELSHHAEVCVGGMPHAENAESAEAGRAALVAAEGCAVGGCLTQRTQRAQRREGLVN